MVHRGRQNVVRTLGIRERLLSGCCGLGGMRFHGFAGATGEGPKFTLPIVLRRLLWLREGIRRGVALTEVVLVLEQDVISHGVHLEMRKGGLCVLGAVGEKKKKTKV